MVGGDDIRIEVNKADSVFDIENKNHGNIHAVVTSPNRENVPPKQFKPIVTKLKRVAIAVIISGWFFYFVAMLLHYLADYKLDQMLTFLEESVYEPIQTGVVKSDLSLASHFNSSSSQEGLALNESCTLLYRLRVTDDQLHRFDLLRRDKILLGTIMTRLCHCVCREQVFVYRGRRMLKACNVGASFMREALKGAHIVVKGDQGWFYNWLVAFKGAHSRISSHSSVSKQYGLEEGSFLKAILTGRTHLRDSWFQFEGATWAPLSHPADSLLHGLHYLQHKFSGKQVGPLGVSKFTDHNPLVVNFDGCTYHNI